MWNWVKETGDVRHWEKGRARNREKKVKKTGGNHRGSVHAVEMNKGKVKRKREDRKDRMEEDDRK